MLILQDVSYIHPNGNILFDEINLVVNKQEKIALIGNNGVGKSTVLEILSGKLQPSNGMVRANSKPYYIPQLIGQFNKFTLAQVLQIDHKLRALREILAGELTDSNFVILDDDWTIEERCREAFRHWQLEDLSLDQKMETLSGGQKTKVFLSGISIHRPEIVLLDEPSNHLDTSSRNILYDYIRHTTATLVVISHDRTLLNLLDTIYELSNRGITAYGGNFDFYTAQKMIETHALSQDLRETEKALRKAKETEKESLERQQKLDARGKKKQEKAGLPTISMNTFKNNAEKSTARMKGKHAEKVEGILQDLNQLRQLMPGTNQMKMNFDNSSLHKGKILVTALNINLRYDEQPLWQRGLSFQITSGERIVLTGANGAGKSSLLKLILGKSEPSSGTIMRAGLNTVYLDQDYSLINDELTVYEQGQLFNTSGLQEHEIKTRLNRFLFTKEFWDKPCKALSGGEKMRLMLCSLSIGRQAPDIIVLDEPTNNLDIQNIEILTTAINEYQGTLLVVSHDAYFLKQVRVERTIALS